MRYEDRLAQALGSRTSAFLQGILVVRLPSTPVGLTLVTPAEKPEAATTTVTEVWEAHRCFTWVLHDRDKQRLHDLRTGRLARVVPPPAAQLHAQPAQPPVLDQGRDYHQQLIYDQVTHHRAFWWQPPVRDQVFTLILPPGQLVLVVPTTTAGPEDHHAAAPVVDVLTDRHGNVTNLWGAQMQEPVLTARKALPLD